MTAWGYAALLMLGGSTVLVFILLAIEMVFRMIRLLRGPRGPRHDAVSAA